jgi:basic membrane protein A
LDYPDIVKLGAGFLLGARSVNPNVTLSVVYTGSWTDVQKGYDAARTMIDTGVDVIIHYADDCGLGVINASKERGTWVIGEILDQNHLGPETVIASYRFNHFAMLDKVLQDYMAGTLKKQAMTFGLEDGYDMLWPLGDLVSDEAKARVAEAEAKIRSGEITVPIIAATENFDALIAEK